MIKPNIEYEGRLQKDKTIKRITKRSNGHWGNFFYLKFEEGGDRPKLYDLILFIVFIRRP